ncbi:Enoyl-[acyl-carrier-protein] reductase [NADH] [Candidatus Erwinia haradaeae]|uniref:Enoyl-[acyl-carrier-protein] reductase [NADH] n=1 Tax=Candidatus Erwinia haradaeae TaxID=1922217 RepID=A0A451CZJ5_9GAMM|nr:enoyl-ACP reductase FabV [Candidatus Erwinia haradaeae]VFP78851.1 Enoyl-[acyl-carrier-protein] reductase [NADH] [Candidatus Erwinia haradaeae]
MIIQPRTRGFICVTAHPRGCKYNVEKQIKYIKTQGVLAHGPKKVLIIGSSSGYGLAMRIASAFGCRASTLGIFFERSGEKNKSASAGWYNSAAFTELAILSNLYVKNINGDAYSNAVKKKTIEIIKRDLGTVDLVVYSLAASHCTDPDTGQVLRSVLKPIGTPMMTKTLNTKTKKISHILLEPASLEEINNTITVMGGKNWQTWIHALLEANVLSKEAKTTAFSYLGEKITHDIYWNGSIGAAKKDLDKRALHIRNTLMTKNNGDARVSVLKAVVTQASSAIPMMPLYLSLLLKVMKERDTYEDCIEQVYSLLKDNLYNPLPLLDEMGRFRMDSKELHPDVQNTISKRWKIITNDNLCELTDLSGYQNAFMRLFGFNLPEINYENHVDADIKIKNLIQM